MIEHNNELIRTTIRVGNSAGVLLPKEWLNTEVKVVLQPLNIANDVIQVLMEEDLLKNTLGAYIVGSYARKEQTIESDIDILIITTNTNKRIKNGKYDILLISKESLEKQLKTNALPMLPMILESKSIINNSLVDSYKKTILTEKNLKWHLETTKSAMNLVEKDIQVSKELKQDTGDATAYSLILRLRTLYIIDSIKNKKMWSKQEFLSMIKKISGSQKSYERYVSAKDKNTLAYKLPIDEAEKLMNYINKQTREVEKWLKGKKD